MLRHWGQFHELRQSWSSAYYRRIFPVASPGEGITELKSQRSTVAGVALPTAVTPPLLSPPVARLHRLRSSGIRCHGRSRPDSLNPDKLNIAVFDVVLQEPNSHLGGLGTTSPGRDRSHGRQSEMRPLLSHISSWQYLYSYVRGQLRHCE